MPRLYSIQDDFAVDTPRYNPAYFFPSASYRRHGLGSHSSWKFNLDKDFPAQCYIHSEELCEITNNFWIALRKDVERSYAGDCFYVYERKNYHRWWNADAKHEYDRKYTSQTHGYGVFHFEEGSDRLMFMLKYSDMLSPKRYRFHPVMGANCADHRYDVDDSEEILGAYKE
jgi:hypothetical protein